MKAMLMLPTVFAAAWLVAGDPDPEKLLKDAAKSMQDITAVLKTVKDKQSAEAAVSKLDEPMQRLLAAMEAAKKIRPDDPAVAKLMENYGKLAKESRESLEQEANRLLKQVDLQKILEQSQAWFKFDTTMQQARIDRAKMDVKSLETVVTTYMTRHGAYPQTLDELLARDPFDNSAPMLTEKAIIDPWNQRYIYEPGTLHPQNGKPLIYSNGPPGAFVRISNWDLDAIPKKK